MSKKTALFIGRFQPLHKGHEHAIRAALKRYNLIFVIGSTNKKDAKNLFTYAQRRRMITSLFPCAKIIGIKDTTDARWTKKIKKLKFDNVISGNPRVWRCLKGCKVEKPYFLRPKKYNGTKVRKLLKEGQKIDSLVPKNVIKVIKTNFYKKFDQNKN